jgi:hypothetical protein
MVAAGGAMAGRMGGYGYSGAAPAQAAQGQSQAESGPSLEGKVRQIGAKTFYWKNKRWVDSSVTPDEDAKATVVTQLTDSYFRLARAQKAEYNQYLSQSEPVTVKLDGTVYHVDPAPPEPTR